MASARGLANHSLYMARLLVSQWRVSLLDQPLMEQALNAAFAPALQLHLLNAYGWFLLACVRVASLPNCPPHDTKGLPALSLGIVEPEEIDECRHLEISGWLAQLQCPYLTVYPPKIMEQYWPVVVPIRASATLKIGWRRLIDSLGEWVSRWMKIDLTAGCFPPLDC